MPLSWLVIEDGWDVVDGAGRPVGKVREVVGDPDADIFDGLRVNTPDGEDGYIPAERVAEIESQRVTVMIEAGQPLPDPSEQSPRGFEARRDRSADL